LLLDRRQQGSVVVLGGGIEQAAARGAPGEAHDPLVDQVCRDLARVDMITVQDQGSHAFHR
jgi:hypothetical protein